MAKGDAKRALEAAEAARERLADVKDKKGEAAAMQAMATAHMASQNSAEAAKIAKEAAALFQAKGDTKGQASALCTAANAVQQSAGKDSYRDVLRLAREARNLFREANNPSGETLAMAMMATSLLFSQKKTDHIESLDLSEDVVDMCILSGDKRRQGQATHIKSQAHLMLEEPEHGLQAAMQAAALARAIGNRGEEAAYLHTAGAAHVNRGDYDEALRPAHESRRIFKEIGNEEGEKLANGLIAGVRSALPHAQAAKRNPLP